MTIGRWRDCVGFCEVRRGNNKCWDDFWRCHTLCFCACRAGNAQTAVAHVVIDTSKPGPEIDRHIYGQFAEHLGRGIYEGYG